MTPADAQLYCETLTKRSGSNFAASFFFLPRQRRAAMYTVYAFCREVDSAVDEPPPGSDPGRELARWRTELAAAYRGTPKYPVTISLARHVRELEIPQDYFDELLAGVEMDLVQIRYATFEELSRYCYRVASVVGLICLKIFGTRDPAAQDYAVNLGLAFQLTNILRDLNEDVLMDRIYLPQEDLDRFGYTPDDIIHHRRDERFERLMRFEVDRARDYYNRAQRLLEYLDPPGRAILSAMLNIYGGLLSKIERRCYDVFSSRVRLARWHKLLLVGKAVLWHRWLGR
jgi:15-cis-phytoene synthase